MLVTGTLKCLHCGYVAGPWVGRAGTPLLGAGFRTRPHTYDAAAIIRCLRCKGPVFLDEAVAVRSSARLRRIARLRRQIAEIEARRHPGRAA